MRLLLSRPLPDPVLAAARAAFDVTLRESNAPLSHDEMVAALKEFDVVLPTLGDRFQPPVFAAVPHPRARLLAAPSRS